MKVLIIEDESPASQKIIRMLREINADIEISDVLTSVEQSINWFLKNPDPDLIFMDIQLEDGTCFEIFQTIRIQTPVIFTTAYDAYTLKAFKVNSVDYLLKPIDPEELRSSINKFNTIHFRNDISKYEAIIKQFQSDTKERFLVKIGDRYKSIQTSDIQCFYILEKYNFILVSTGSSYPIDYSLDKIESLVDPKLFFRISRNFIVNLHAVEDIIAYSSSRLKIILKNWNERDDIIVSRERVSDFKKWMDN